MHVSVRRKYGIVDYIPLINCFTTFNFYNPCKICTSISMGSSEIWDKYHSCCIGNLPFPIQQEWYLSQTLLLPMLFPILAVYTHAVG